jgi:hypothetical protein
LEGPIASVIVDEIPNSVARLTDQLRHDPGLGWSRLRDFLTARNIGPAKAAFAVLYPDDVRELLAVLVVSSDRMFEVGLEWPEGVRMGAAMDHALITEWEDDAALVRRENQPFVDIALDLLASE